MTDNLASSVDAALSRGPNMAYPLVQTGVILVRVHDFAKSFQIRWLH